jgi:hypothetical protein
VNAAPMPAVAPVTKAVCMAVTLSPGGAAPASRSGWRLAVGVAALPPIKDAGYR